MTTTATTIIMIHFVLKAGGPPIPSSVGGSGTGEVATAEPATGPTSIVAVAVGDTLISPSSFSWLQVANRAATSPLKGAMQLLPSL